MATLWVLGCGPGTILAGTLEGHVACDGRPVSKAEVLTNTPISPRVETDRNGSFALTGLEPGHYTVAVVHGSRSWGLQDIEVREEGSTVLQVDLDGEEVAASYEFPEATAEDLDRLRDEFLAPMGEPPFCSLPEGEAYRFVWLRTFDPAIVVEIERLGQARAQYRYREFAGAAGYEIGETVEEASGSVLERLVEEHRRHGVSPDPELAEEVIESFFEAADEQFWALPFRVERPGEIVLDGAAWIMEGRQNGRCHVVSRRSPGLDEPFRQFVEALIFGMAGRTFEYGEVY